MTQPSEYKRKKAVALSYDETIENAPKVSASGQGKVAERILSQAKEHDVPVQEDETLVELLSALNINETIPEDLYQVVAEVFAFIYQVDRHEEERT
ncbi:EscU/YscU/HrcU family type III secretion system export apparatus switch protein [Virgibacillus sp. MSP4-1]|uniref:EscU/YscU/HrcU family type III secretion system export apparatus switch protein n=1 Tax=Virgibacillus sp. MSP4-1 TaxID=2700081 RepID=UPI00039BE4A4|nr:EscU/YscU/HrcU family type III secretion system export apparatus switch protein [Virgibacillus sp. MSP4-1]QHS22232.1 EscU/YscU/HrcU family type III secretion system export apparatus switch protein [Virgibacillus sp. MSP4-1]